MCIDTYTHSLLLKEVLDNVFFMPSSLPFVDQLASAEVDKKVFKDIFAGLFLQIWGQK